jgi:transcriptional regulator with XRE-family HTH domain
MPARTGTFGERFREARLSAGLTQKDVARVLDIRENDIRRWETDRNLPTSARLPEIAVILGVSIDHLFGIDGKAKRQRVSKVDPPPRLQPAASRGGRRRAGLAAV